MGDPNRSPQLRYWTRKLGTTPEDMLLDAVTECERRWPRRWTERIYWRDVECLLISVLTWTDDQKLAAYLTCRGLLEGATRRAR